LWGVWADANRFSGPFIFILIFPRNSVRVGCLPSKRMTGLLNCATKRVITAYFIYEKWLVESYLS
jgi:hypothetical protein